MKKVIDFGKYKVENIPTALLKVYDDNKKGIDPFFWRGILFKPTFGRGNTIFVKNYVADFQGLKLVLEDDKLFISNSIHKFFKGDNYSDFTHSELIQSIDLLSDKLGVSDELIVPTFLEFGINTSFSDITTYLESIAIYKGKSFAPMKKGSVAYGRKLEMHEVYTKAYDKSKEFLLHYKNPCPINDLLRVEIGLKGKRQLSFIPSLADLKKEETLRLLQSKLLYYFELIEFDECYNLQRISNRDLELLYAGKNPVFWKDYRKSNTEVSKKRKQDYKKLCSERRMIGLKDEAILKIKEKTEFLISN